MLVLHQLSSVSLLEQTKGRGVLLQAPAPLWFYHRIRTQWPRITSDQWWGMPSLPNWHAPHRHFFPFGLAATLAQPSARMKEGGEVDAGFQPSLHNYSTKLTLSPKSWISVSPISLSVHSVRPKKEEQGAKVQLHPFQPHRRWNLAPAQPRPNTHELAGAGCPPLSLSGLSLIRTLADQRWRRRRRRNHQFVPYPLLSLVLIPRGAMSLIKFVIRRSSCVTDGYNREYYPWVFDYG